VPGPLVLVSGPGSHALTRPAKGENDMFTDNTDAPTIGVMTEAPQPQQHGHPAWRHAIELGPVLAAVVFAAGAAASMARVPLVAVIVIAVAIAGGLSAAAMLLARSAAAAAWAITAACSAAGWAAHAAVAGPWSWAALTGLVVPTVILTPLWPAVRAHEARLEAAERRRQAAAAAAAGARRWPEYLARIGHRGVQFVSRDDTLSGYSVRLRLPASGRVTFKALASSVDKLEVAARARRGSLRFEQLPGGAAHEVVLHVAERDFLAETIPLPAENRRRSINDPIPVGVHEDGTVCTVTLREVATLIAGLRGSGKSNILNVLIAQLARCVDVIIFVIDLKGGRMAAPWLRPWLDAQTPRPVVDWLAADREEAEIMLRALLRGIYARSRSGAGGEKIIPSVHHPAVIVIVDEAAVVFGMGMGGPRSSLEGTTNATLAGLATRLTVTGRSEAIDAIFAVQRGTVTMTGSGDLKSQCAVRIGLGVATEADARLIIPDDVHIAADLARLSEPGSGIVQVKQRRAAPVKFYRIEHDDIAPVATATGNIRPAPDPLLREALGAEYEARWTERGSYLVPAARQPVIAPPGMDESEFEQIVRSNLADIDQVFPGDDDTAHPGRKRMREFLRRSPRGVPPGAIVSLLAAEKMPVARQTVQRWLAEDEAAGLVERGTFGQWKWKG
jgi:FtsK/SpoIIIE family